MNKFKSFLQVAFIKKWFIWLILIIAGGAFFFLRGNGLPETIEIKKNDFTREVSVVGTVIPSQETNMAFEMSGRVNSIYKKVGDKVFEGDRILSLESSDVQSKLLKAEADYDAEIAKLNKLNNNNSTTDIVSIRNVIRSSYTSADDAIRSKVDQFFNDPNNRFPDVKIYVPKTAR
jgi:HlyD family secretion protein